VRAGFVLTPSRDSYPASSHAACHQPPELVLETGGSLQRDFEGHAPRFDRLTAP